MNLGQWMAKTGLRPSDVARACGMSRAPIFRILEGKGGTILSAKKILDRYKAITWQELAEESTRNIDAPTSVKEPTGFGNV